jgi:Uma2 family endonuclease
MQVDFPDKAFPLRLSPHPARPITDAEYYTFCMANPDLRIERTAQGELLIVPPSGGESDYQCVEVILQLGWWAKRAGRGKTFGSNAEFMLPTGAALSPDAAWVSNHRLAEFSRSQLRKFPPLCPEFVIEVMSPSDRLRAVREKMHEWMRAGVELAWLIYPDKKTIYIYRAGQSEPETRIDILTIAGEGPVEGFELDLTAIWAGL